MVLRSIVYKLKDVELLNISTNVAFNGYLIRYLTPFSTFSLGQNCGLIIENTKFEHKIVPLGILFNLRLLN